MNQFSPKTNFETSQLLAGTIDFEQLLPIAARLRRLAARINMHHAFIHRLGPPQTPLADATYDTTLRNIKASSWMLADLINPPVLERLLSGNSAIAWQRFTSNAAPRNDVLHRLDICFGISVPFHNALGNHVALTFCDSVFSDINTCEIAALALPLIDTVLTAERACNTAKTSLSQRETQCLQWAAAGKTSLETGMILGLSPHTVNQYLTAATTKLKAVNRTHAVTKAVRLGLINLSAI